MKTIIACTDFSHNANNAVQYAATLAKASKAKLILYHYFSYPTPATDLQAVFPTTFLETAATEQDKKLEEIKTALVKDHHITVKCVTRSFDLYLDLESVFQEEKADLVVMGMQGHNAIVKALFGNVPSGVIRKGKLPLLVVPEEVVFQPLKKILFPFDGQGIENHDTLQPLRDLAILFDAYIEVLTLFDLEKSPELVPKGTESPAKRILENQLAETSHGYSYENEPAVDKGILYEATRSSADMVAMIPHHHSFLSNLLNQSETQRIANTISLPLLVLGERVK